MTNRVRNGKLEIYRFLFASRCMASAEIRIGQLDSDSLRTAGTVFFFPHRKGLPAFPAQSCRGNQ